MEDNIVTSIVLSGNDAIAFANSLYKLSYWGLKNYTFDNFYITFYLS